MDSLWHELSRVIRRIDHEREEKNTPLPCQICDIAHQEDRKWIPPNCRHSETSHKQKKIHNMEGSSLEIAYHQIPIEK